MSNFVITELDLLESRVKARYTYASSKNLIEHIQKLIPNNNHSLTDYNVKPYRLYICFLSVDYLLETQIINQEDIYFSVRLPNRNFVKVSKLYNKIFNLDQLQIDIDSFEKSCFNKIYNKNKIWIDNRNDYQYSIKSFVIDNETNSLLILCDRICNGELYTVNLLDWNLHFSDIDLSKH